MKNTITTIIALFMTLTGTASVAVAQNIEAKPFNLLLEQIESARFTYRQTGMVHGFHSISSCLYTSDDIVVLKNYCYPKKKYPAKGYTIFSRKFGVVDVYQEQLDDVLLKKDINITVFPEALHEKMTSPMSSYRIRSLNPILEHFYKVRGPSCWSTNFSWYTETADAQCNINKSHVSGFAAWADETQSLNGNEADWANLIRRLERKFPK